MTDSKKGDLPITLKCVDARTPAADLTRRMASISYITRISFPGAKPLAEDKQGGSVFARLMRDATMPGARINTSASFDRKKVNPIIEEAEKAGLKVEIITACCGSTIIVHAQGNKITPLVKEYAERIAAQCPESGIGQFL